VRAFPIHTRVRERLSISCEATFDFAKLDVLDDEVDIPVGIGVDSSGKAKHETMKGWKTSTRGITEFKKLPQAAQEYILYRKSSQSALTAHRNGRGTQRSLYGRP